MELFSLSLSLFSRRSKQRQLQEAKCGSTLPLRQQATLRAEKCFSLECSARGCGLFYQGKVNICGG